MVTLTGKEKVSRTSHTSPRPYRSSNTIEALSYDRSKVQLRRSKYFMPVEIVHRRRARHRLRQALKGDRLLRGTKTSPLTFTESPCIARRSPVGAVDRHGLRTCSRMYERRVVLAVAVASFRIARRFVVHRIALNCRRNTCLDVPKETRRIGCTSTACQRPFGINDEPLNEMNEPPASGLRRVVSTSANASGDLRRCLEGEGWCGTCDSRRC